MTLKPTDMLEIQSAIDEYERKFPRRPAPSAEVALAWRLGKREAARRMARSRDSDLASSGEQKPAAKIDFPTSSRVEHSYEDSHAIYAIAFCSTYSSSSPITSLTIPIALQTFPMQCSLFSMVLRPQYPLHRPHATP